ncbi:hypothetical protein LTR95_018297, partial [Oleoguttula sp. CCFEE 5521]
MSRAEDGGRVASLNSTSYGTFDAADIDEGQITQVASLADDMSILGMEDTERDTKSKIVIGSNGSDDARLATDREHDMPFLEAIRLYPTAIGWSIFFSLG